MTQFDNFIDGTWQAPRSGQWAPNVNPARPAEVLGAFAASGPDDVSDAVAAAGGAARAWAASPPSERSALLVRLADLMVRHRDELARIIVREQGKALGEALGEVGRAAAECRYMAGESFRLLGATYPSDRANCRIEERLEPVGVVALISPWNFPLVTPIRKLAPALACGNAVVMKPASLTPWSSVRLTELLAEAGAPPGLVNLVLGSASEVGTPLVAHPDVAAVSFTGSTQAGQSIYQAVAQKIGRVQLELGGKNPALVLDCDNPGAAAKEIVAAAFQCAGQRCTAISRVIVAEAEADALVAHLLEEIAGLKVGDGLDPDTTMGPLVDAGQLQAVQRYVQLGRAEGAELRFGGTCLVDDPDREGYFHAPTLFDRVASTSPLATEEMFGPILPVVRVATADEAIVLANATPYGLAASVFTANAGLAERCLDEVQAGMIHVNHGTASQAHVPFGGDKRSGEGAWSIGPTAKAFFTKSKLAYRG
ncbi:aldehyde dehydrogenase family protein [Algihabitans albus]|uniref:aldehyde dehydrogenase family protein n=1 Tax=Algihabitans albus TaxID=2164067 RepID=UPI0035D12950